jgi:GNAT superfamily N-acetyltransferase
MQFVIRCVENSDIDSIGRLSEQWGYQSTQEKMLRCLTDIRNNSDHVMYVLLHDEQIIGWIHGIYSLRIETDPFVEIAGLVVDKDHRRLGLGKSLVDKIVEWSQLRNCRMIRVRCNIIRKEANVFYKNIGFNEIKEQKVYDLPLPVDLHA